MLTPTRVLRASKWTQTLKIPKSTFPPRPSNPEAYLKRCTDDLYALQALKRKDNPPFVLHDGPPYANGKLHIGHALNKILKDMICRAELAQGKRVEYIPGWDCHGLPIEIKALQAQKDSGNVKVQGDENGEVATRKRLRPVEIRRAARQLAERTVEEQKKTFKEWAIMADWDNSYKTMSTDFELRQLEVFQEMVRNGLIHRQYKPVHWSPSSGTALAEAELEYDDNHKSTAAFVKFPILDFPSQLDPESKLKGNLLSAVIWTTTPWTLPANKAIAVHDELDYTVVAHPDPTIGYLLVAEARIDELQGSLSLSLEPILSSIRGKDLAGKVSYANPIRGSLASPQPLISADFVSAASGSGLVHLAPGHGMDDYNVCSQRNLSPFSPVDDDGKFTSEAYPDHPDLFEGLNVQREGTQAVVHLLSNLEFRSHTGFVLATHEYTHKYPIDWRTKQPIIVRATEQWFANLEPIKQEALQSLTKVKFVPEAGSKRLESFINGRSQWCISRQRAWGVPIPALFRIDVTPREAVMDVDTIKHITNVIEQRGIDAWWEDPDDELAWIPAGLEGQYVRGKDTMDVWFDSGTSWKLLADRGNDTLADVYLEGSDQHRGWFQSSLLTHVAWHQRKAGMPSTMAPLAPFRKLITHGFTLDQDGKKMSKSLGNIVSPDEIINGTLLPPVQRKKKKGEPKPKDDKPLYDSLGPDALRLWVASSDYTKDVVIGQQVLQNVNLAIHKYRVTFKWLLGVLNEPEPELLKAGTSENAMLSQIDQLALYHLTTAWQSVQKYYVEYLFNEAARAINSYVVNDLSAFYFETLKDRLYTGGPESRLHAQIVLSKIFVDLCKMLAPITPLLVEEVWDHAPAHLRDEQDVLTRLEWPKISPPQDPPHGVSYPADKNRWFSAILQSMNNALKTAQERARAAKAMGSGLECDVDIVLPPECFNRLQERFGDHMGLQLANILVVSKVTVTSSDRNPSDHGSLAWQNESFAIPPTILPADPNVRPDWGTVIVNPPTERKCARCWRYLAPVEDEEKLCQRCEDVVQIPLAG